MAKQNDVGEADLELQPTSLRTSRSNPAPASETNVNAIGSTPAEQAAAATPAPPPSELVSACQIGDLAKVEELINSGEFSATDAGPDGITPLHWAAINNRITVCKYLLDQGALVDAKGGDLQATPLHWAARGGLVYIVHLLIQYGADPLRTDSQGFNALLLSVHSSNVLLVIYLLHQEIPVDTTDPAGRTALHWAAYQGDALTVDSLLNWGADVKIHDASGFTALHWAIVRGNKACMKRLIEEGSDVQAVSNEGKTTRVMAEEMNSVAAWNSALKEAGRNSAGGLRQRTLSVKSAKIILFFAPYVLLFAIFNALAYYPIYFSIPIIIALFLGTLKLLGKFILPNVTTAPHAMIQTPFYSGVFSGSAFWVIVHYLLYVLPYTFRLYPILNLIFVLVFGSTIYCFFSAMFMDPGMIPKLNGISEQRRVIDELIERGEYDTGHFCISTYVRKPLRSKYDRYLKRVVAKYDHYCPWVNNVVGVRNHKRFLIFVLGLTVGIPINVVLFSKYVDLLPLIPDSTCSGSFELLCHAIETDPYGTFVTGWASLQLIWVFFLAFVQLAQVSRAITTNEASNLHRFGYMGGDDFSSLPLDHASNPDSHGHAHNHSHAKKRWWTPLFKLLGIDQFINTAQDTMASKQTRRNWRASNPADQGLARNCVDFWFPQGNFNIYKTLPEGGASLGSKSIDYYKLWDFPDLRNNSYERVDSQV